MAVISWRTDVNTRILDSTTISTGEGGWKEDSSENGFKQRRAVSLAVPDKYQVTMDFDWLEKDENGNSEFDRFLSWYKYRHMYGTNPFWFESIARFNINGPITTEDNKPVMCQYKITSGLSFSKSGFCMRCTMTWEDVYTGIVQAKIPSSEIDHLEAENGKLYIIYSNTPDEYPSPTSNSFYYSKNLESTDLSDFTKFEISRTELSGSKGIFYTTSLESGTYKIVLDGNFDDDNYHLVMTY